VRTPALSPHTCISPCISLPRRVPPQSSEAHQSASRPCLHAHQRTGCRHHRAHVCPVVWFWSILASANGALAEHATSMLTKAAMRNTESLVQNNKGLPTGQSYPSCQQLHLAASCIAAGFLRRASGGHTAHLNRVSVQLANMWQRLSHTAHLQM
jgi:hypothetical protein